MATNEEGEFELVLGNKQLLSVFFIVVLLLFVFFAMGYMVGRNTVPASTQMASNKAPANPMVVEPAGSAPPVIPPATTPAGQERPVPSLPPVETKSKEPPKQTASLPPAPLPPPPAKAEPPKVVKAEPAKPTPPPKVEPPKTTAAKASPPKVEPPKPPVATVEPPKPVAPTAGAVYLQVSATNRKEAELMAEVLSKKGFPAITTPVPDQPLYRVMVGPLRDAAAIAKTKDGLTAAGFKSFIQRKL